MSLCNTFRLSVVCVIIVLSSFDAPVVAFTLRRKNMEIDSNRDLAQEQSVLLKVKRELDVPDKILMNENKTAESINNNLNLTSINSTMEFEQDIVTEPDKQLNDITTNIPNTILVAEDTTVDDTSVTTTSFDAKNVDFKTITYDSDKESTTHVPISIDKIIDIETTTYLIDVTTSSEIDTDESGTKTPLNISAPNKTNIEESNDSKVENNEKFTKAESDVTEKVTNEINEQRYFAQSPKKSRLIPKWKKYKTIERKRPSYSSEEKPKEINKENNKEDILKSETKHAPVTLQDAVTSDIPSLESLKNDLLSSNLKLQTSESKSGVAIKYLITELSTPNNLTPLKLASAETLSALGHESKRAGFLNFSGKTANTETTTDISTADIATSEITADSISRDVTTGGVKSDSKTNVPRIFVTENSNIHVQEAKTTTESQVVWNDDAIKEELLKEEVINDNQENRLQEVNANNADLTIIKNVNTDNSTETNLSSELSVKTVNSDRSKNNTLYAVNPNYKPMKKIEIVPPKQFVRDPDDNSWRNESLSSLGIVFKPKNSSKPFTQVLKNKTETEWNHLSEKDIKNDLPDLRERLQKMAEKRKSKRKKIDPFGNVVYFDYEENSGSAEQAGVTIDELTSTVTTYSPGLHNTDPGIGSSSERPINGKSSLTTDSINRVSYSTRKPNKFLHEYYDSTDEDDSDYLNMAQIDLKKFTTSLRSSSPFHPSTIVAKQPDWLKNSNKVSKNTFPERKATVQYFPPTTQKVNFNDYDNDFKFKVESFTTETDVPKRVSIDRPTTPVTVNTVASKSGYTKNLIITQPYHTTEPSITLVEDGSLDRGTYVIKHYKDFLQQAAKDSEYDKNLDYTPYTAAPVEGVTKPDFTRYYKEKPRTIDSDRYEYEPQYRKDVLQRFVDNFNHNSERYRSDFPILFNSSIIHGDLQHGRDIASSRAFMRGSYNNDFFKPKFAPMKSCEPNCEKLSVELSPAYELHYYVPDQEEKEEAVPQPVTQPYKYTL